MDLQELQQLIRRYNSGQASPEEKARLERWYEQINGNDPDYNGADREVVKEQIRSGISQRLSSQPDTGYSRRINLQSRWMQWAAVLLIAMGISFYFYQHNLKREVTVNKAVKKYTDDLKPGGNKATLTLAGGQEIVLNNASNGILVNEGNAAIRKTRDGQLVYNSSGSTRKSHPSEINIISTPVGGQYQVTLSDGTKVWLNSASSLKFPPVFSGNARHVEVTGEAYFEVAKNKIPFYVKALNTKIKVLGTHFNVMAYSDEEIQETTLLEGSVNISRNSGSGGIHNSNYTLSPGQQARISSNSNTINVLRGVDTDYITAWKDGLFLFDNTAIEKVMNQVRRWYNAEIIYESRRPEVRFTGVIPRSNNLSDLLRVLEMAGGVKFSIKGNRIIVINDK
ncbi:MAG TPA: FecR domain-containing protein [Sphingobacteriaceae bacterium]